MLGQDALFLLKKPLKERIESASIEMKKACRASKRYGSSQELFARWPNLRESSERLTSLLTLHWPDQRKIGESLLVNCLDAGFADAEESINKDNNDLNGQKIFIRRVSEELSQCLGVTLMIKRSGSWSVYEPNIQGYLDAIMNSPASEELEWVRRPQNEAVNQKSKLVYASRVFTLNELSLAGLLD
jgi:hypothetical protein